MANGGIILNEPSYTTERRWFKTALTCLALLAPLLTLACQRDSTAQQSTPVVGSSAFEQTWARADLPVQAGEAQRTWIWGPAANTEALTEVYVDNAVGRREVLYYDKARMEINDPAADVNASWYITNGLLVVELINGRVQVGDDTYLEREAAHINVAGDGDDPNALTYATLA